jgi:uncharacterized protein YllA (UPF0747 family)
VGVRENERKKESGKVRERERERERGERVTREEEERRLKIEIGRMDAIKAYINPNGNPQEREENFMKFYLKNPDFIAELLSLFDPFDFNFMILKP